MSQSTEAAAFPFETIALVGVGLIGGSLAAALKRRGLGRTIIGVGRDAARLAAARARGLVNEIETSLAAAAAKADLLVFCTPVDRIVAGVREAAPHCRAGALLTDAGSVKGPICEALTSGLPGGVEFVGSHPLAGSEKQGFEFADPELFVWKVCVVTPLSQSSPLARRRLQAFWEAVGSTVVEMSPGDHDRVVARTSHCPHVVAAALAATLERADVPLAASGFRDTTRIAGGDPDLWTAILLANADAVLAGCDALGASLAEFQAALKTGDAAGVKKFLATAKQKREWLGEGARPK